MRKRATYGQGEELDVGAAVLQAFLEGGDTVASSVSVAKGVSEGDLERSQC